MTEDLICLSVKLKKELFQIVDDLYKFSNTFYEKFLYDLDERIQEQESIQVEHSMMYYPHLYWWAVFCAPLGKDRKTIFDEYIHKNLSKLKQKKAVLHIVLQWRNMYPSFYLYVQSLGDRVLIVKDLFDGSYKVVTVHNNNFQKPASNQLLTGLILPFGNGTYCTIIDFLHISLPELKPEETLLLLLNQIHPMHITSNDLKNTYPKFLARSMKSMIQEQIN